MSSGDNVERFESIEPPIPGIDNAAGTTFSSTVEASIYQSPFRRTERVEMDTRPTSMPIHPFRQVPLSLPSQGSGNQ